MMRICAVVLAAFTALAACFPIPSRAILMRADSPQAAYLALGKQFPQVGYLMDQVGCTLIDPRWVIAAAHSIEGLSPFSDRFVRIGGQRYAIEKIIIPAARVPDSVDSSADLALVKLSRPVTGVTPSALYAGSDEVGQIVTIAGRGRSGTPQSPALADDGKLRAGTERVDAAIGSSLFAVFHAPPQGTPLEAAGADGDSGGPAFISTAGTYAVAGVSSFASGDKRDGSAHRYQTLQGYARISSWRKWILDTIAADPPSSVTMFGPLQPAGRAFVPDTPAGRAMRQFVSAFNAGSSSEMIDFYRAHGNLESSRSFEERAAAWNQERAAWGRLEPRAFAQASGLQLAVAAYSARTGKWIGILFAMKGTDPERLDSITTGEIPRPELQRM